MKKAKKFICFLLSTIMVLSTSVTAFAANSSTISPYNMTILEDTSSKRVVQTSDENYTYITTYDKLNDTMQFTKVDIDTNVSIVGNVVSGEDAISTTTYASTRATTLKENTFTNYEYTKTYGDPNEWELRRPDGSLTGTYYFKTYEVTKNKSYINTFKSAVDTINTKEGEIVAAYGLVILGDIAAAAISAGAIATGGVLTPAAWTSIIAAAGANTAYVSVCVAWDNACKTAYDAYYDTFTKSPTIFY